MEAAASVAVAARGVSMTMPSSQSQSSRKEWRVVSDHPVQNSGNEVESDSKLGQGEERLIYEGREPVNVDFFSIAVDGGSDHELHLDDVVKQREQLQHLEVNLKARLIARSEVMGMQERFDSQIKEHITAAVKLQEQLHEREKAIMDLQRTLDDKDKELHAIRLDHEAAWAKEDLLREQNKELATFRRERDNSEAERAQHLKKIHDLQEHVQEKERQFIELQEQHRVAQETLIYKDEKLREAQAWIARVQEMDALQSTTNHSLQAELRERTEQYNQLWIGCQRQFSEMERLHLHTLQQLEIELSEARERNGTYSDGSRTTQTNVKDTSHFLQSNGSHLEASGGSSPAGDSRGLQNGDAEIGSAQTDIPAVQMAPQSLHGLPTYFPPGQLAALHPFMLHHQGLPQNANSHLVQSHVGQFHSVPANSSLSHWQNQQAFTESLQMPNHEQYPSHNDQNPMRPETNYNYEASVNGQALRSDFLDANISQGLEAHSVVPSSSNEEEQVFYSTDNSYIVNAQSQQSLQQISSQFHASLRLNHSDNDNVHQERNGNFLSNNGGEPQNSTTEHLGSAAIASEVIRSVKASEGIVSKVATATTPEGYVASGLKSTLLGGKTAEMALFDEETLLACVVRTIPPGPGGRIQISSTLLSRLNKMLAPLHWADYENKHGKLDVFLGCHPELFVIEGDHIQVREGAQEIIAAMVAHAKVRAAAVAASATSSHPSLLSSIAVTPMAQTRLKKAPSTNSQHLTMQSQLPNGVSFNAAGVRVLSKQNDQMKPNGSETRPGQASVLLANGNGINPDRANVGSQSKVISHGRSGPNYHGKQQARSTRAVNWMVFCFEGAGDILVHVVGCGKHDYVEAVGVKAALSGIKDGFLLFYILATGIETETGIGLII
ncbi:hypothetical protein OSB04_025935 [Centaurea solstitialis]|uniref:DUF7725 domain-containing protein n=1 Tax=Centaurea solstitialis TaxID=347529 RepID=A0AA38SWJ9_9ASTR|nr:hypothetical protein OSB04_025935 [Centaurea solstitialis]